MRLIDADALSKGLQDELKERADEKGTVAYQVFELFIEYLAEKPTIDAVPVVRCKDCKHSREQNIDERKYLIEGVLICTSPDATDECWNPVFGKHFCSCGEPKE